MLTFKALALTPTTLRTGFNTHVLEGYIYLVHSIGIRDDVTMNRMDHCTKCVFFKEEKLLAVT